MLSDYFQTLIQQGIPQETIVLLLMLPIVATVVAFFRHIIGIKSFGIYAPIILAFAYYEIGRDAPTGLKYGIPLTVLVIIAATLLRIGLKRLRLHYIPRMSILITLVAVVIIGILAMAVYTERFGFISISPLPILLIITIVERFVATQIKKGGKESLLLTVETLLLSIVGYYLISWQNLQNYLLQTPEIIALFLLANLVIGRWTGLRLMEFIRFRKVISSVEPTQTTKE